MLLEKGGNRLKQERKCEYKIIALHVLRNNSSSFLLYSRIINNNVQLRDIGCFQAHTNQQGCLTALMETFKCITTSRNLGNTTVNFKVWLLTRVYIDPPQFTKVRLSNRHSKLEIFEIKLQFTKPTATSFNTTILKHKKHNELPIGTFYGKYFRMEKKTTVQNRLLLIYSFFILIYKNLDVHCNTIWEQSLVSSTKDITKRDNSSDVYGHINCHKNTTYKVVITIALF